MRRRPSVSMAVVFTAARMVSSLTGAATATAKSSKPITLTPLGTFASGVFDDSGAEIVAHHPGTQRLFVTNVDDDAIDVLDVSDPSAPTKIFDIDISPYGGPNSVAVSGVGSSALVGVAVENDDKQQPGQAVFFDTDGNLIGAVAAGALPDMITFTPNGQYALVANEAEPSDDYSDDPEGSITIVDVSSAAAGVSQDDACTAGFADFALADLDPSVRVFGPGATVAQDLEPEYITVSNNSSTAYVSLQENNGIAVVDIASCAVTAIHGLGFKDHSAPGNGLDPSDKDSGIHIANWPTFGTYLPDAVASLEYAGDTYIITANEGDSRDYDGFSEEARVKDLVLDPTAFPNAASLQANANLGRLKVTTTLGDTDNDGDYDELYSFGARSFSICDERGNQVFDSGDQLEQITASLLPDDFNSTDTENGSYDSRSDDKGPEPEGLAVGKVHGRTYAFIGFERVGGIMVYDVTDPRAPTYVDYINTRDFAGDAEAGTAGDLAPEGMTFIPAGHSPIQQPLLAVAFEVSGTTTLFRIDGE